MLPCNAVQQCTTIKEAGPCVGLFFFDESFDQGAADRAAPAFLEQTA
jgi:hypothetical protein